MKVLVTGAAGFIGRTVVPVLRERHEVRTLDRQPNPADPAQLVADLTDAAALREACAGIDVVLHLAATNNDRPDFVKDVVPHNIGGTYNVLEAARQQQVRRVVFASSCQTVAHYPGNVTVSVADPVRPKGPYGATKVFGEALGRAYHDNFGLEFIAIRLGAVLPYDMLQRDKLRMREIWLSPRDCVELLRRAVEKTGVGYAVVFGSSVMPFEHLSLREAREVLGFEPQDRWTDYFEVKT